MIETESGPKRLVITMLLVSTRFASKVQVNSALVYPSVGTLFKLTVARVVSPTPIFGWLITVDTYAPVVVGVEVCVALAVAGVPVVDAGNVEVGGNGVTEGVSVTVPGPGVIVAGMVEVGVAVGGTIGAFNNGLNNPRVSPFFVKVVLFRIGR